MSLLNIAGTSFPIVVNTYATRVTKKNPVSTTVKWAGPKTETVEDKANLFKAILVQADLLKEGSSAAMFDKLIAGHLEEAYDDIATPDGSFDEAALVKAIASVRRSGGMTEKELIAKQKEALAEWGFLGPLFPPPNVPHDQVAAEEAASEQRIADAGLTVDEAVRRFSACTKTLKDIIRLQSDADAKKAERAKNAAEKAAREAAAKAATPA